MINGSQVAFEAHIGLGLGERQLLETQPEALCMLGGWQKACEVLRKAS